MSQERDFFSIYLDYVRETEPPYVYHRWCAISAIAAMLGRNFYLHHGHFRVFPNLYVMLLGESGTRKSTAIKLQRKAIRAAGYETFAATKTTKEKFLLDLEGAETEEMNGLPEAEKKKVYDKILEKNLWGDTKLLEEPREVYISADEFNVFAGAGNLDFYETLGDLWDWDDPKPYTHRLKNSRSVSIFQPTINILGGNTPDNFARAFPPEIMGQGFLSRMLLIHGERSDRKYSIPPLPLEGATDEIVNRMRSLRNSYSGAAVIATDAAALLDKIYHQWDEINDVRFRSYSTRRYTQLLKLCLIVSVAFGDREVSAYSVIAANTFLAASEAFMPEAIGQFGKGNNSDIASKVMQILNSTKKPLNMKDIWAHVHKDLKKMSDLGEIMSSLQQADKVQLVVNSGWLPKKTRNKKPDNVDWSLLTEEERLLVS